jgi:hypothetical protein
VKTGHFLLLFGTGDDACLKKKQWISAPGNEVDGYPLFDVFMIAFAVLLRCLILL